ncbi:Os11g0620400, partial [Oryza sativa Japonica Group]
QLPSPPQSHRLRLHPPRAIPLPPAIAARSKLASPRYRRGTGAPSFRRGAGAARIIPSVEPASDRPNGHGRCEVPVFVGLQLLGL